ncbi:hypothetical protein [Micromonospora sp. S4605]|uniref:hypothetical protein n=1 Tax=Micromonospora sp. S4605 TaxID=1420897 RepID=UPI001E49E869|nr:hypothetical protein [Micromonospora sp. S4605]
MDPVTDAPSRKDPARARPSEAGPARRAATRKTAAPRKASPAGDVPAKPARATKTGASKKAAPAKRTTPATRTAPAEPTTTPARQTPAAAEPATTPAQQTPAPAEPATTPAQQTPAPAEPATTPAQQTPAPAEPATSPARAATTPAAKKAAPVKKATAVKRKAAPTATPEQPAPEQPETGPVREAEPPTRTPELRAALARLVEHPGFAPELLALAAVEAIGPRARDWADRLRSAYPDASPDGLARLATRRFVRQAGAGGATAALAGAFAPLAELAAVLWTQANLVLHLAAAYGRDPAHPDRAAELLVLTQVHPDAESARTALTAARAADGRGDEPWTRAVEAAWRLAAPLAAQAGGWLVLRLASRVLPGAAVLAAAAGDSAAAARLAARAVTRYRPPRSR